MRVLVLNASLKHGNELSNTEEVTNMVLDEMRKYGRVDAETIRLADKRIPVGLGFRESDDDEWPEIADKLRKADIVIFATPIWWGQRSSLIQRVIERMDAFDEEAHSGRADLLNKVAGVVITGSEDGGVRWWDVASGNQLVGAFPLHKMPVRDLACSPDGQTLASGGRDQTIQLWDVATGKEIRGWRS